MPPLRNNCKQQRTSWKAELAKGIPVAMYNMVSCNINTPEQASAKLVVQGKTPLHFIPPPSTGIAALLAAGTAADAKDRNARLLLIWGTRKGIFAPVGACVRATRAIPADTAVVL